MFRSELSGVLGGLSRVRQISLDDAHVFCAPEQVGAEVELALSAIERCYGVLGLDDRRYRLSLGGAGGRYLGTDEQWAHAQDQLRGALERRGLDFFEAEGEAAFYGPKIDIQVAGAHGREETVSTVQLDFTQPERFGLEYTGEDGRRHRPAMIHRGVLGSMERLIAMLVERFEGRMPPWLSPRQVAVLPVGDVHGDGAGKLRDRLVDEGIRVDVLAGGSLGSRIRAARLHRDPYIAIVGDEELAEETVSALVPQSGQRACVGREQFVQRVRADVRGRVLRPSALP